MRAAALVLVLSLVGGCPEPAPDGETAGDGSEGSGSTAGSTGDSSTSGDAQSSSSSTGPPQCPYVDGSYSIGTNGSQKQECFSFSGTTNTCAVAQTDCELKWFCNGAFEDYLPIGPIDPNGVYEGQGQWEGSPVSCTITFLEEGGFDWECAVGSIDCYGSGF